MRLFKKSRDLNPGADPARKFRGEISVVFGSQVSLRVLYCNRDDVYFTTLLWQNKRRQNGLTSRMLFSELHKMNKVTFVGFKGAITLIAPLDPPLLEPWHQQDLFV